ncbi:NADPH-dependent cytochrome P450 oxidoreductase [Hesseltinella vesiculosa]|uniref:NADPH--cytochrome P450 reductase n=1 Tax=Hesseltinella vesiculosa TaxID=101127 RepID=A0A1X2G650_9FUNG|nr:NADPH-dependent cytochrome P450 oxidoreductase [Hesseltinella vesiculosa]
MLLLGTVAMGSLVWMTKDRLFSTLNQTKELAMKEQELLQEKPKDDDKRNFVKLMLEQGRKVVIFYGSQTGTAEDFAQRLGKECKKRLGVQPMVADMELYDLGNLDQLPADCVAVFVIATYGEGDPTDNATEFWELLQQPTPVFSQQDPDLPLSNLRYFMFGLGNSTYEYFNGAARVMDKAMTGLGATRLGERGEGDDDNSLEDDFVQWQDTFFPMLQEELGDVTTDNADTTPTQAYQVKALETAEEFYVGELGDRTQVSFDSKKPFPAAVTLKDLTPHADQGRHCLHLEIDLTGSNMTYQTGDHLGIWPTNNEHQLLLLTRLFGWTDAALDQVYQVTPSDPTAKVPFPQPTTLRAVLRHYLDIAQLPSRAVLEDLLPSLPSTLTDFVKDLLQNKEEYQRVVVKQVRNLGELMAYSLTQQGLPIEGALQQVPLAVVLECFSRLQPRYYSISSSSSESGSKVHVTAVLLQYEPCKEEQRTVYGVNTNYLWAVYQATQNIQNDMYAIQGPHDAYVSSHSNDISVKLPVHVRSSTFRLPAADVPIIMIGPGTGVAPFRGFVRERVHQKVDQGKSVGANLLFFGCRRADEDFLYRDEWPGLFEQLGDESEMICAFSRESEQKVYVQHRLAEQSARVWDLLSQGAYVYVCGDAKYMAKDVLNALINTAMEHGGYTQDQATTFIQDMRANGRYQEDVWA